MTAAWALLWLLAALAALLLIALLLLLLLPLDLRVRLDSDLAAPGWEAAAEGRARWSAALRWGWGLLAAEWRGVNLQPRPPDLRLLGFRLRRSGRRRPRPGPAFPHSPSWRRPGRPASGPRQPAGRRFRWPHLEDPELVRAVLAEGLRFLGRLWEGTGLRAGGRLTYGFPDPAVTGWCEAVRWAAGVRIPFPVEPSFDRPCLVGWAEVTGRIYGFEIAREALRSLRNKVIRRRIARSIRFRPLRILIFRGG